MTTCKKTCPTQLITTGFALVLLALIILGGFSLWQSEVIRRTAATLAQEHQLTAQVIDELACEQQRAILIMVQTIRGATTLDKRATVQHELEEFTKALPPLIQAGRVALPEQNWGEYETAANNFSAATRQAMEESAVTDVRAQQIANLHDGLLLAAGQVLVKDSLHAARMNNRIERALVVLVQRTGWGLGVCFLLALFCAGVTIRFTTNAIRQMGWQNDEINRVSWHLMQGQEAAARRLSHEMHDELGQSLTALKAMIGFVTPAELPIRRVDCLQLLDETIGNVRELSQLLRPVILDDFGLPAALRWLADRFQERTRILVELECDVTGRFADNVETHLFRITQEALTNIARHSQATHVQVSLVLKGEHLRLTVRDNGIGLSANNRQLVSLGLVGMRARAEQIDGIFSLKNDSTGGVIVQVSVPIELPSATNFQTQQINYAPQNDQNFIS